MLKAAVKKEETAEAKKTSETRRFVDGVCELPTSFADDENMDPNSQAEYRSVNVTSDGGGSDMDTSNIYTYPFVASTSSVASTNHPLLSIKTPFNADVTVTSPIDPEHSSGFSVGFGVPPPPPPSQHSRSPSSDATSSSRRHRHRRHSCSRESRCYHHHHHHAHRHGFAYRHHHRQDIILPRHPPEYSEDPTCWKMFGERSPAASRFQVHWCFTWKNNPTLDWNALRRAWEERRRGSVSTDRKKSFPDIPILTFLFCYRCCSCPFCFKYSHMFPHLSLQLFRCGKCANVSLNIKTCIYDTYSSSDSAYFLFF